MFCKYHRRHKRGMDIININHIIFTKPAVIKVVPKLAEKQNMPAGLKIAIRNGPLLYDSTWIAGVGYEDEDETCTESDNEDDKETSTDEENDEMEPEEIYAQATDLIEVADDHPKTVNEVHEINKESIAEEESDDEEDCEEEENEEAAQYTRSGRATKPPAGFHMVQCTLPTQTMQPLEYSENNGRVIATVICHMNDKLLNARNMKHNNSFRNTV